MRMRFVVVCGGVRVAGGGRAGAGAVQGGRAGAGRSSASPRSRDGGSGMIVTASGGACRGVQRLRGRPHRLARAGGQRSSRKTSRRRSRSTTRRVDGGVKIMNVQIAQLAAGQEAKALVTFEIRRSAILPPEDTDIYVLPDPKKLPREIRPYLRPARRSRAAIRRSASWPRRSAPTRKRPGTTSRRSTIGSAST